MPYSAVDLVSIGLGNGLKPYTTQPLLEPLLAQSQSDTEAHNLK